jgi:membrane protease YdiL (CAAX protease family)
MRVKPSAAISIALFVVYGAVVAAIWAFNGVDYDTVAESSDTVLKGIVIPVGVGAVFLAVAATWLGWWRPAMVEERKVGPRWGLVIPALLLVAALSGVVTIDFGAASTETLLLLALGTALVGFSEELLTRGLMIVGFRGSLAEGWVWFLSSLLFGLLHGLNVFFGQSIGATLRQIVFAFVLGTAFYVTRRLTGLLVVTMVIHAVWDFGVLGTEYSGGDGFAVGGLLLWPIAILAFIVLVKILRSPASASTEPSRSSLA